jgi:hypothetical protein
MWTEVTPAISFNRAASLPTGRAPRTFNEERYNPLFWQIAQRRLFDFRMIVPAGAAGFASLGARLTFDA